MNKFLKAYLENKPVFLALIRSREAEMWQEFLPLKAPVVDVGCGDGFFAKTVFGTVDYGLDLADSRIKEAERIKAYKKLIVYDGKRIPLKTGSVATVVSNCVLEHVENLNELVGDIYRVLKPGGMFLTTVMAKPWEENLALAIFLGNRYRTWMRKKQVHLNLLSFKEWKRQFSNAGFKLVSAKGYLDRRECKVLDLAHYLSIYNLLGFWLAKKWVICKRLNLAMGSWLWKDKTSVVTPNEAGAVFFVLKK